MASAEAQKNLKKISQERLKRGYPLARGIGRECGPIRSAPRAARSTARLRPNGRCRDPSRLARGERGTRRRSSQVCRRVSCSERSTVPALNIGFGVWHRITSGNTPAQFELSAANASFWGSVPDMAGVRNRRMGRQTAIFSSSKRPANPDRRGRLHPLSRSRWSGPFPALQGSGALLYAGPSRTPSVSPVPR